MYNEQLVLMHEKAIEIGEQGALKDIWNVDQIWGFMEAMEMSKEQQIAFFDEIGEKSDNFSQALGASMQSMVLNYKSGAQIMKDAVMGSFKTMEGGLKSMSKDMLSGGKNIGKIWKGVAKQIAADMIFAFLQIQFQRVVADLIGKKSLNTVLLAEGKAKAAAAWQGAYSFAAISGPLGATVAANLAYGRVLAQNLNITKSLSGFAAGSSIFGAGSGTGYLGTDSVNASLKPDEIVLNSNASSLFRSAINSADGFGSGGGGGGNTIILQVSTMDSDSFVDSYHDKIEPLIIGSFKNNAEFRRGAADSLEGKVK
jgi:hypothetical protein